MASKPNILVLMADQLAPQFTGAYGHPLVQTPNIDKLAESGCVFDSAYTPSPLCAPARFSFMSGQLPFKIKAYDNASEFPSSIPTFCHYLRREGYHACLSGKMHFIGPDQLHGFSERLTTEIYPADFSFTPNWLEPDERIDVWYHNMSSVHEAGTADVTFQLEYDDEVAFHAIRKLYDYAREPEQLPFIMVASFTHPHDPYVARQQWWNLYDHNKIDLPAVSADSIEPDAHSKRIMRGIQADSNPPDEESIRNARHAYYANVSYFDDQVGRFVDTLKRTGLYDNTVIFVTADHGDMLGERGLWYKMHFYEHSARVPLIVSGPEVTQSRIKESCTLTGLLPTFLDFATAGRSLELDLGDSIDGGSFFRRLTDRGSRVRDHAVSHYAAECTDHPIVMLRYGRYKYIHSQSDPPLLFDLEADPQELLNLADREDEQQRVEFRSRMVNLFWKGSKIRDDVIADQQARLMIQKVMNESQSTPWDFQPFRNAADDYVRAHKELDNMAAVRRFPKF